MVVVGSAATPIKGCAYSVTAKERMELSGELHVRLFGFIKDTLGVKRATTDWDVSKRVRI